MLRLRCSSTPALGSPHRSAAGHHMRRFLTSRKNWGVKATTYRHRSVGPGASLTLYSEHKTGAPAKGHFSVNNRKGTIRAPRYGTCLWTFNMIQPPINCIFTSAWTSCSDPWTPSASRAAGQ